MSARRIVASAAVVGIGMLASLALSAAPTWAAGGMKLCVPKKEGAGLVTPQHGKCKKGYKLTNFSGEGKAGAEGKQGAAGKAGPEGKQGPEGKAGFTTEQAEQLKTLLPYIRFVGNGVAGKPTIQFSGVNVQIVNGEGNTQSANGEGNLVIGYDENNDGKHEQTGSHNLILGVEQTYTSFGGIVDGFGNTIKGEFASVTGGESNTASGPSASVSGGIFNTASGYKSSVSGGKANIAGSGEGNSVSGGSFNTASGFYSSISGGTENKAEAELSWIGGGKGSITFPTAKLSSIVSQSFGDSVKENACVGAPHTFFESSAC
jgi:hypothetical protein